MSVALVVWLAAACPQGRTVVAPVERVAVAADEAALVDAELRRAATTALGACAEPLDDATVAEAAEAGCDFGPCLKAKVDAYALLGGALVRAGGQVTLALRSLVGPGQVERAQTVVLAAASVGDAEARRLEAAVSALLEGAPGSRTPPAWARPVAWTTLGLALAAAALAVGLGVGANGTAAALEQQRVPCAGGQAYGACARAAYLDGRGLATGATGAWVSAAVLALVSGGAWLLSL